MDRLHGMAELCVSILLPGYTIYRKVCQPAGVGLQDTHWQCSQDNFDKAIRRMPQYITPNDQYTHTEESKPSSEYNRRVGEEENLVEHFLVNQHFSDEVWVGPRI